MKRLIFIWLLTLSLSAHAYFDPGVGSMVAQFFIAFVAAVSVYWRKLILFIKGLFYQFSSKKSASEEDTELNLESEDNNND